MSDNWSIFSLFKNGTQTVINNDENDIIQWSLFFLRKIYYFTFLVYYKNEKNFLVDLIFPQNRIKFENISTNDEYE